MAEDCVESDLIESARELHEAVEGVSDAEAACKPDPSAWSVADCVEHLALAEMGLLKRLAAASEGEPIKPDAAGPASLAAIASRALRVEAPAQTHPTERFGGLSPTLKVFDRARRETVAFVRNNRAALAGRTTQHPLLGPVSGEQMVRIMAAHVRRHVLQIREILTARE